MNPHRGLLHHQIITVSNLARSKSFYHAMFAYLGYELADNRYDASHAFEDWKPWCLDTPHEISIMQAAPEFAGVPHQRGAAGHHHHLAFCADSREDVDRFHAVVLVPLANEGHCIVENPPCDCPEYGDGYYATFFCDPDGLKYEFVLNPNYLVKKAARDALHRTHFSPCPMETLPPLMRDQRKVDAEHLNLLAVFHFVIAGLALLGLGFLFLHYSLLHHVIDNPEMWKNQKGPPPPAEFFAIFKWFYWVFGVLLVAGGIANLLSGVFLRRRRYRLFSLIVGAINCVQIPLGTVLGIFTIIVLVRESVQERYRVPD